MIDITCFFAYEMITYSVHLLSQLQNIELMRKVAEAVEISETNGLNIYFSFKVDAVSK